MTTTAATITSLNAARGIALKDAHVYQQIVPGVLPVIAASQPVELRRWGAEFLAETFASPVLDSGVKEKMSPTILDTLLAYLGGEDEDTTIVKGAIQCAASVYPFVLKHTIEDKSEESQAVWSKMAKIKSSILRRMDSAPAGVRICCIKFVARVVQVQTPGVIADPRRPEQNEISLALVPRDHSVLVPSNLEAEASGLLDRLLGVFQDNMDDALIATATLNSLSALVQRRPVISSKILAIICAFNPLKLQKMTGRSRITARSTVKNVMFFLINVFKHNPEHPLIARVQQQIERLRQSLKTFSLDPNSLKREAPDEPIDGLSREKRQRIEEQTNAGTAPLQQQQQQWPPPLPPSPVTYAQMYTLVSDPGVANFDVRVVDSDLLAKVLPVLFNYIDQARFDEVLNVVRKRLIELERRPPPGFDEDDEEYDPDSIGFGGTDAEQVANRIDQEMPGPLIQAPVQELSLSIPAPPPLTEEDVAEYSEAARERLFETLMNMDHMAMIEKGGKKALQSQHRVKLGFSRLAASSDHNQREGWVTLLTRLATRPAFELGATDNVKEEGSDTALVKKDQTSHLPSKIRESLHRYIMDDWQRRLDVAIAWLNEEWYLDRLLSQQEDNPANLAPGDDISKLPTYIPLTLSLLDAFLPYIDSTHSRQLVRFLSEIPFLPPTTFERIEKLAANPTLVQLCAQVLLYLIMFRPPVRQKAVECAVGIWRTNPEAREAIGKMVGKWAPEVLEEAKEREEAKKVGAETAEVKEEVQNGNEDEANKEP